MEEKMKKPIVENLQTSEQKSIPSTPDSSLDDLQFHYLIMQTSRQVGRLHQSRTAKIDLCPGQPKILQCLYEKRANTPKGIGQWCVLDKSSTTTLLKLMEQKGLIERIPSEKDRRSCFIELTLFGRQRAMEVLEIGTEVDQISLKGLSQEEKKTLKELLDRVSHNAQEDMKK